MKFTPFLFSLGCELVTLAGAGHTLDMNDEEITILGNLLFNSTVPSIFTLEKTAIIREVTKNIFKNLKLKTHETSVRINEVR